MWTATVEGSRFSSLVVTKVDGTSEAFTKGLSVATYKGVPCTLRNAKSGQYGGVRNFYFVTRGAANGAAKKWIKWVRSNPAALKIAASEWVPFK